MANVTGSDVLAKSLVAQGVKHLFYIMGGPMLETETALIKLGVRAIDTRHEQAASFMAHAYGRVLRTAGLCMGASGPGMTNLLTGMGNAYTDAASLVAIGGSSPTVYDDMEAFQEIDQVSMARPVTKWAQRAPSAKRVPDMVASAFRQSTTGRRAPVYLDMPGDVLGEEIDDSTLVYPGPAKVVRTLGDPAAVTEAIAILSRAERPIVIGGSGVWWSDGAQAFQAFVEATGVPFYTTPMSRGSIPEDHDLAFLNARVRAFSEADVLVNIGTRFNYIVQFGRPPRFAENLKVIQVDVDPTSFGRNRPVDVPIEGDARNILEQLTKEARGKVDPARFRGWVGKLRVLDAEKGAEMSKVMSSDDTPIHPLRLCKEVRDFMNRDGILVVDGQEILNFGRQSIPTYVPGHRLNSGSFGCMGVGLPFGIGAKVAKPDKQVVVLHGDGSFGINAMEIQSAVRHNIPVICVISLNGGWTADPQRNKPGRDLGYARYDKMAEAFGAHGEYVEKPNEIRPALDRAAASGKPAVVNVMTDFRQRATTVRFSAYST
jgi:acetolactate synthase-1/2/3 large subunit